MIQDLSSLELVKTAKDIEGYPFIITPGKYQTLTHVTDQSTQVNIIANPYLYYTLGLCGETGELIDAIKKSYRISKDIRDIGPKIIREVGDVTWYSVRFQTLHMPSNVAIFMARNQDYLMDNNMPEEYYTTEGGILLAAYNADKFASKAFYDVLLGEYDSALDHAIQTGYHALEVSRKLGVKDSHVLKTNLIKLYKRLEEGTIKSHGTS